MQIDFYESDSSDDDAASFFSADESPADFCDSDSQLSIDAGVVSHFEAQRPVLAAPLAAGVSMLAQTARLSLAATGAVSGAVLSTARWSTTLTLSIGRSIIVGALSSARILRIKSSDESTSSLEYITDTSIKAVTDAFSLAELFTYGTWHLADSSIRMSLTAATETIQILDGIFGSTETSRAISSIVALIQDEIRQGISNGEGRSAELTILGTLGSIATLGSVSKALTAFACLQAATYQKSLRERKQVETVFDGVVDKGGEEGDVSVRWHHEKMSFDGAMTRIEVNQLGVRQRTSMHTIRRPTLLEIQEFSTDDDEFNGIVTLEAAKVLVQETQLQGKNVRVVESVDSFRVAVAQQSAILPDGLVSIGSDGKMSGDKAFLDRVSRDFSGKDMNSLMKDFENESLGVEAPARTSSHQNSKGKGKAFSFFRALIGSKADESETPQSPAIPDEKRDSALISPQKQPKQVRKRQSVVTMFDETRRTQQSTDGAYIEKFEYRVNNHQMKSSEQNSNTITRASDGHNYKQYPLPHLLRNFERYCRFSSAAYGAEFMKLMGVGNLRDIHTSDESIHANHFAFAIHAGIPVNDIILSSYTDYMLETGITQAKPVFDPVFHYVALDRFAKVVVVALRGTLALNDVLTDLKADYADFMGHRVHSGMLRSAVLMYRKGAAVREAVRQALEQNPGYGLVLTGHSLGGGVASLLALRWACPTPELGIPPTSPFHPPTPFVTSGRGGFPRGRPVHCFAYGSPCVVSLEFSVFAKGLVSTLVNGDDIVPTLSIGLVRDMKAVTMSLLDPKNRGLSERIIWRTLGFHNGSSPSSTTASNSNKTGSTGGDDDDYLWNILTQLKGTMQNERLFVAGNAYWMVSSETVTLDSVSHRKKSTWHVKLERMDDVQEMSQEPRFSSRLLSDHFPTNYEQTLGSLIQAVFENNK